MYTNYIYIYIYIYKPYIYINLIYIYITVHPMSKYMSCHNAIVIITGRAHCFHNRPFCLCKI